MRLLSSCYAFLIAPYEKKVSHHYQAYWSANGVCRKVSHGVYTVAWACPVVNAVVLFALQYFQQPPQDSPNISLIKKIVKERFYLFPQFAMQIKEFIPAMNAESNAILVHPNTVFQFYNEDSENAEYTEKELQIIEIEEEWNEYVLMNELARGNGGVEELKVRIERHRKHNETLQQMKNINDELVTIHNEMEEIGPSCEKYAETEKKFQVLVQQQKTLNQQIKETSKNNGFGAILDQWTSPPPQKLIIAIIDQLEGTENILSHMTIPFLRDCAMAYPYFAKKCLNEDKLWNCFNGFPEYIADISIKHPEFALGALTTNREMTIERDTYRFELFQAAYPKIIESIENKTFTDEQMQYLADFLLHYTLVIKSEDFEKIIAISTAIKEMSIDNQAQLNLIRFVIGKLSLQGIYEEGKNLIHSFDSKDIINVFQIGSLNIQKNEIYQRIMNLETDELDGEIQEALLYLAYIPQESPSYIEIRMLLGKLWADQKEHTESGKCYLQAASKALLLFQAKINELEEIQNELTEVESKQQIESTKLEVENLKKNQENTKNEIKNLEALIREARILAATMLLVKRKNESDTYSFFARNNVSDNEDDLLLSFEDINSFASNTDGFMNSLKTSYKDNEEFLNFLDELN